MRPLTPRPGSGALGGPLVHLDVVGSTNDRARRLALAGAPHGTVVTAEQQTAGRGRQGRTWSAPAGRALTLSALVRLPAAEFEPLPLAVAIAVCEACEAIAPVACRIKWPNDVWIDHRKVAGVLIEARPLDGWAVIGIGLNVDTREEELPGELRESAGSLRIAVGGPIDRDAALDALLARLAAWVARLDAPAGIAAAFRERDALHGERIAWTAGQSRHEGEAGGIDEDGALVVFTDNGERVRLDAGEVHLERRRAGAGSPED
jgi:BirA family transcriptional regulator, biotin operon repressor / biotin---[acetyl-CoA-carboxylase] ligase